MKSKYLVLLLIFLVFSCKKEDPAPNQLLKNTDMEYNPTLDNSWINFGQGNGFTASWVDEESSSPIHSLKIYRSTHDSDTNHFWYYVQSYYDKIPVGYDLTLRARLKGVNLEGEGVSLAIRCDGNPQQMLQFETTEGNKSINGTFDWTDYTLKLTQINKDVKVVVVFLIYQYNTTGTVYFDDVTLTYN
jgi:hypothetical protein